MDIPKNARVFINPSETIERKAKAMGMTDIAYVDWLLEQADKLEEPERTNYILDVFREAEQSRPH